MPVSSQIVQFVGGLIRPSGTAATLFEAVRPCSLMAPRLLIIIRFCSLPTIVRSFYRFWFSRQGESDQFGGDIGTTHCHNDVLFAVDEIRHG